MHDLDGVHILSLAAASLPDNAGTPDESASDDNPDDDTGLTVNMATAGGRKRRAPKVSCKFKCTHIRCDQSAWRLILHIMCTQIIM